MRSKRWRWLIVLVLAVAGAAAGGAVGATGHRVYSSTATMSAGPIAALSPAQAANQSSDIILASDYATLLTSDTVAQRIATQLHTSAGYVSSHLSATAEAGTPLFDITGQGPTAADAQSLTAAATVGIRDYVGTLLASQHAQPQLLSQYQQAEQANQSLKARIARLQQQPSSGSNTATLQRLQSQLAVVGLKLQGLASLFMQGDQTTSVSLGAAPQIVTAPLAGTSSARKKTAEYAAVGLLAGLCLGVSLIVLPGAVAPPGAGSRRADDIRLGQV